ncbi:slit homolog 2 protein-like [Culicoides brevitarsis]|uniref:slit homolog 2 protein-like n=1 Tax=Culicoides brevitarsis TaxID=469753 RepID=UPI00307BB04E
MQLLSKLGVDPSKIVQLFTVKLIRNFKISQLEGFQEPEKLTINSNIVIDSTLGDFCPKLKTIVVRTNSTEFNLAGLENLEVLNLNTGKKVFPILGECKSLRTLTAYASDETEEHAENSSELLPGLPNIESLVIHRFSFPKITGETFSQNQKLILTGNGIEEISQDAFVHLKVLKILYLHANKIMTLSNSCLPESIVNLQVSNNLISHFEITKKLPNLSELNLMSNKLTDSFAFESLTEHYPALEYLGLRNNEMETLSFGNLKLLRILTLNENKIKTVKVENFVEGKEQVVIDLKENPIICDCDLKPFLRILQDTNTKISLMWEVPCNNYKEQSLMDINLEDIKC